MQLLHKRNRTGAIMETGDRLRLVRSALYVPGSNARALEKAQALDADMLIIDLEDAVAEENKAAAREAAIAATQAGFPGKLVALRTNGLGSAHLAGDLAASAQCKVDALVFPKIESAAELDQLAARTGLPMIAMVETPAGLFAAREIATHPSLVGLIAGTNDIAADTGIRPGPMREGLELALQTIILAAAVAGKPAFDGVCNRLDDLEGFEAECRQGRCYGFTGKTLIHPNQISIANAAFSPTLEELADARELVAAANGGAQRFQGRMIESMHVEEALRTIERAGRTTGSGE
jgi:(3S)-malyl-CoA thioesterase